MEQKEKQKIKKNGWLFTALVAISGAIYAYFSITAPSTASGEQLGLTGIKLFIVQITIIIPFIFTWIMGAIAVKKLKSYSETIGDESESKAFKLFSIGITYLVAGLVISQLIGLLKNFFQENISIIAFITILVNYINILFPLIGFILLWRGAKLLSPMVKSWKDAHLVSIIIVIIIGIIFSLLIFTNQTRQVSLVASIQPTYFISDILIVISIILPTLTMWFFGFSASLILGEARNIQNKNGITKLIGGIWIVVFSSIIFKSIVSLGTLRFISFGLAKTLGIIYLFLIVIGIGYYFIAYGSKKLLNQER